MPDNNTRFGRTQAAPSLNPPDSEREIGAKISEPFFTGSTTQVTPPATPQRVEPNAPETPLRFAGDDDDFYPEDSTGRLVVRVQTALGSFPVEEAAVIVSAKRNGTNEIVNFQLTDKSGTTPEITVPAPQKSDSLQPSDRLPFSDYTITVRNPLYYTAITENVQVFGDELSVQVVELTPLPELVNETDITRTVNIPRQNL